MTTFTDERLAWRNIPTRSVFGTHGSGHHLERAGYTTLGDILSATEDELVGHVMGVGPVRAARIRQRALVAAQVATLDKVPAEPATKAPAEPATKARWLGPESPTVHALVFLVGFALGFITG